MRKPSLYFLLVVCWWAGSVWGQMPDAARNTRVRGQIEAPDRNFTLGWSVEMTLLGSQGNPQRVELRPGGGFDFPYSATGQYRLSVVDAGGRRIHEEVVVVDGFHAELAIRMDPRPAEGLPAGIISVARLRHQPPKRAVQEFRRALRELERREAAAAVPHLERALRADPEYVDARNLLGTVHLGDRHYEEALQEFHTAARLDPQCGLAQRNLAMTLSQMGRFAEAEGPGRRAVRLAPLDPANRWVLGSTLAALGKESEEALAHLRLAAEKFPKARLTLAQVLARRGARQDAAREVRAYLDSADVSLRPQAEQWLTRLSEPSAP